jgi:hypothetical protein
MATAGYSGTPLVNKLGIKPGTTARFLSAPDGYEATLGVLPEGAVARFEDWQDAAQGPPIDPPSPFFQLFVRHTDELEACLGKLRDRMARNGVIWVSWPKRAAGVKTDLNENVIREIAIAAGLVDVKVCAVDDVWSALKLVIRVKDR